MATTNNHCRREGKDFTFIWKIDNFSHCEILKGDYLDSSTFRIGNIKGDCKLRLYPRGKTDSSVECYLNCSYLSQSIYISPLFCVCTSKGELLYESEKTNLNYLYNKTTQHLIGKFEGNILESLHDDTLFIHCHVCGIDLGMDGNSMHCFGHTRLKCQRRVFYWTIEKFSSLKMREKKVYNLYEVRNSGSSLTFELSLAGRNLESACVQISIIFKNVGSETFSTCTIFLIEENGTSIKYMKDEYWLDEGNKTKNFPHFLTRRELIARGLHNDTLFLRGEVTLSGENHGLEQVVYGLTTQEAVREAFGSISRPSQEHVPSALSADMLSLFGGSGPESDFELRVEGRSFPVHQLILGTRSAVFRAMFDNDMLEQSTKSAELTDMDADTAEQLLKFAYADVEPPAGLAWEPLASLYSAADKYQILALRKICARRLVQLLHPANAPKILQLADRHRDSHLKEDVTDFIFKRGRAVLESDQWKNLQQDDPNLGFETFQKIFCEKVLVQTLELSNVKE